MLKFNASPSLPKLSTDSPAWVSKGLNHIPNLYRPNVRLQCTFIKYKYHKILYLGVGEIPESMSERKRQETKGKQIYRFIDSFEVYFLRSNRRRCMVNGTQKNHKMRKMSLISYWQLEVEILIDSAACLLCFGKDQLWWCHVVIKMLGREFPGGPVVKTPCFHCRGPGFDPCWGN